MKYFSEKTRRFYDDVELCKKEEAAFDERQAKLEAERKALAEARKERAKEIEDAYKEMQDMNKAARAAERHYLELRNKFVKDYGSFHMTVSQAEQAPNELDFNDLFNMLFF